MDKTLNNWFLFIHVPFISEFCSGIIDLLNLHQHSPNDSARGAGRGVAGGGAVGEGVRLWLFIYCYIDIKLTQTSKKKNKKKHEIDQIGSFILIPSIETVGEWKMLYTQWKWAAWYCVMFSIVYIVHIRDKSIFSLFCVLWNRLYNVTHE